MFKSIGVLAMLPLLFWIVGSTEADSTPEDWNKIWNGGKLKIGQSKEEVKCMAANCKSLTSCTCKCMCKNDGSGLKGEVQRKECKLQCWIARMCRLPCELIVYGKKDSITVGSSTVEDCKEVCNGLIKQKDENGAFLVNDKNQTIWKITSGNYMDLRRLVTERVASLPTDTCRTVRNGYEDTWKEVYPDVTELCHPYTI